jgi:transposase
MDDEPTDTGSDARSASITGPRSARSQRIEVITRGEPRRRWSVEQKREIATESLKPGVSPIAVARRYGVSSGQLGPVTRPVANFARVEVMATAPGPPSTDPTCLQPRSSPTSTSMSRRPGLRPEGLIEIALPGGVSVRVDARVDSGALRRVLGALLSR